MRRYDAVFLDAQGTLLKPHPSVTAIYADACRQCGGNPAPADISAALKEGWLEYKRSTQGRQRYDTSDEITRQWWTDYNSRLFRRLGLRRDQGKFVDILWESFGSPENWRLFPESEEVLAELRRRNYRLGIVSNWDSRLIPICEKLGVTTHLDFILASAVVGVEKPDPRIFRESLARVGVPPHRAVHVGDDYEADVQGAQGAGMDAIHLDRDAGSPTDRAVVRSLRELLDVLQ